MENLSNCFPWHKLDDLILFGFLFVLIIVVAWMGHWDLVNNLSSALMGAITMYIKGHVNGPPGEK